MGLNDNLAAVLAFTDGALPFAAKPTAGQVLARSGDTITGLTLGGGGTPTPTAVGDIMYSADGATWTRLAVGAIGRHLAVSGSNIPSWREMSQYGTSAARPAASIAVESVLYWSTDAAAGLELAQCIHTGSEAYSWQVMAHDVTATGIALAQAASAAAARTALGLGSFVGAYSTRPAQGAGFTLFYPTDGYTPWVDDGSVWRPVLPTGKVGTAPPAAANWTAVSGTTATLTDAYGALLVTMSSANGQWTYNVALAATFTIELVYQIDPGLYAASPAVLCALGLGNSSGPEFMRSSIYWSGIDWIAQNQNMASRTATSGGALDSKSLNGFGISTGIFVRTIVRDGTNTTHYISRAGGAKTQMYQVANAAGYVVSVNQLSIYCDADGTQGSTATILSLKIS